MNNSSQQITLLFETTGRETDKMVDPIKLSWKLVLSLVIIITNSLVLVVVWRVPVILRSIDILLVSLAVVDNLTGLSVVFQMCLDFFPELLKNKVMCLFYFQIPMFFTMTSLYIILVVAFEQYMIMFHNIHHQRLRNSKCCTVLFIASAYIVSGLLTIYPYLDKNNTVGIEVCSGILIIDNTYLMCISVNIWVVVILCSVFYVKIICAIRRQMRIISPFVQENASTSQRTTTPNVIPLRVFNITQSSGQTNPSFTKMKQIRLRFAVMIGFAVCFLPISFIPFINLYHPKTPINHNYVGKVFMTLGSINSFVNPLIYLISRRTFRQALRTLCRCSI